MSDNLTKGTEITNTNFESELNKSGNKTTVNYDANDENYFLVHFIDTTHTYKVDSNGNIRKIAVSNMKRIAVTDMSIGTQISTGVIVNGFEDKWYILNSGGTKVTLIYYNYLPTSAMPDGDSENIKKEGNYTVGTTGSRDDLIAYLRNTNGDWNFLSNRFSEKLGVECQAYGTPTLDDLRASGLNPYMDSCSNPRLNGSPNYWIANASGGNNMYTMSTSGGFEGYIYSTNDGNLTGCGLRPIVVIPRKAFNNVTDEVSNNKELEYIESTGTQYILTDIVPTNTMGVYMKLSSRDISSDSLYFGSRKTTDTRFAMGNNDGNLYFGYNTLTSTGKRPSLTVNQIFTIENNYNNSRKTIYKENTIDDITSNLSSSNTVPIAIFAGNYDGSISYKSKIQLYEFKISKGTDITHEFIPVYNTITNSAGLYDTKNNKFYGNNGDGKFIAGPEKVSN